MNNIVHASANIHPDVNLGSYNRIGKNVVIDIIGSKPGRKVTIGDNNVINDNTRLLVHGECTIGDWNVFHNDMLVMAEDHVVIGHNCWFGQNTILDGAGGLVLGNGVRVGMYSQIWTHVASGEQIEGCTLFSKRKTTIEDDVWLVGSCVVGSGLHLGKRSIALINSVLTKDTVAGKVYAGSPAKLMEKANYYEPKSLEEKFQMLKEWLQQFVELYPDYSLVFDTDNITLSNSKNKEEVIFTKAAKGENLLAGSVFFISDKTYRKTNSLAQREIYKYLYNNKARFLPIQ